MSLEEVKKVLAELDKISDDANLKLRKSMVKESVSIYNRVIDFAASLERKPNGTFAQTTANLKKVDQYFSRFKPMASNSEYAKKINEYVSTFGKTEIVVNDYFALLLSNYTPKLVYHALAQSILEDVQNKLMAAGVDANFKEPIKMALKQLVAGGSNLDGIRQTMSIMIQGNTERLGLLERYVSQVATDTMNQYVSTYTEAVSSDLGLEYYLYQGTKIEDTRDFCRTRAGKVYTKKEVQSWASKTWQGKIPETNKTTIFTYRGGYNCRHFLIPISKEVYNALK